MESSEDHHDGHCGPCRRVRVVEAPGRWYRLGVLGATSGGGIAAGPTADYRAVTDGCTRTAADRVDQGLAWTEDPVDLSPLHSALTRRSMTAIAKAVPPALRHDCRGGQGQV